MPVDATHSNGRRPGNAAAGQRPGASAGWPPAARAWRRPRRRRAKLLLRGAIAAGVVAFLVISALLARYLSAENAERGQELAVLQAQARGDAASMLALLEGCSSNAGCAATVRADASRLRRRGAVKILSLKSPTAGSLTGARGVSRVAWTVIGSLPVVQCFDVRRTGNPVSGIHIALLSVSAPIPNEGDC